MQTHQDFRIFFAFALIELILTFRPVSISGESLLLSSFYTLPLYDSPFESEG